MGSEMDDNVQIGGIGDVAQSAAEVGERGAEVLEQRRDGISPEIRPHVYAVNLMAMFQQVKAQVRANLTAGAGYEDAHLSMLPGSNRNRQYTPDQPYT